MLPRIPGAWVSVLGRLALLAILLVGSAGAATVGLDHVAVAKKQNNNRPNRPPKQPPLPKGPKVQVALRPTSADLAGCFPGGRLNVTVTLLTDRIGFDVFTIVAQKLPPNRDYTVFLLESPVPPNVGGAEYIGDFTTDAKGNAQNAFRLIVEEAFTSVNGGDRRDLNQIGVWFADPADDEFCVPGSAPTPFDGDGEAGVQIFNSLGANPLPPP